MRYSDYMTKEELTASCAQAIELKSCEIELISGNPEVFDDIRDNAAGDVSRVPRKRDEAFRAEGIGIMTVAAGVPEVFTSNFSQTTLQLAAVERRVFAHNSSSQDKLVAKCGRDRTTCIQQRFQMSLGSLLKTQNRFTPIPAVRMAARQKVGLRNPDTVFVSAHLDSRNRNYHSIRTIPIGCSSVNQVRSH
jgi:hypothetical protein